MITKKSPIIALILATLVLMVNFWAWSLISPLGAKLATDFSLSPINLSIMLAIPILIGAISRIPLGILTDYFGGRKIFILLCFLASLIVIFLAFANSYNHFLVAGALLGIAGGSFAVGIPFVNAWFPPKKRGLALGIYSMGNIGTAVSGFLTPFLVLSINLRVAYLLVAGVLALTGIIMFFWLHDSPEWKPLHGNLINHLISVIKNRNTWDLSLLYAVSFGAFVAFGVYLPILLKISYDLSLTDAAARAAGFIAIATITRPLGGWLSDRFGGQRLVRIIFIGIFVLAAFVAFQPALSILTTVIYLSLAFFLGCGNGAIISLISKFSKTNNVGSITGIVGACGVMGGFLPPIILGITYQYTHSYSIALLGLSLTAIFVFLYINMRFKHIKN